jgi:nitrogen fixation protein NifU and related proteins
MTELKQLYQEVILDHNRNPRNFRRIESTPYHADGFNPLCGDQVSVYLSIQNGIIEDASFHGKGCAISVASASLMTEALKGKTCAEAETLFTHFHTIMTEEANNSSCEHLGKLAVLQGVKDYPTRIKCATLAWHASQTAMHQLTCDVSTE